LKRGSKETGKVVEIEQPLRLSEFFESWEKAPRALRLASLVAEYGEILKSSFWAKEGDIKEVFRHAQVLSAEFSGDPRVAEFVVLAGRATKLKLSEEETAASEKTPKD